LFHLVLPLFALFGSDSPSAQAKRPASCQSGARAPGKPGIICHEGLTALREAHVIKWETKLQRLGKPLPDPHQIAKVSSRIFFHCKLVYFGLFHFILVDFPAPGRRQPWTLEFGVLSLHSALARPSPAGG
jgi:hypothetical protein